MRKLTTDGKVTIPVDLRRKYNLLPGTKVKFIEENDGIEISIDNRKKLTHKEVETNIGFLGKDGHLLETLMDEKKREREF